MELRASERFAGSAARLAAILTDPAFYRACLDRAAIDHSGGVVVTGTPDGPFSVSIRRTMAAVDLPPPVRVHLPGGLDVRQVNAWDAPDGDGGRRGTVTMEIIGAPVMLRGTVTLKPLGPAASELAYVTHLRAHVPLLGATLEEAAAPAIRSAIRAERDELMSRLTP
jgi:hypothetical protein